MTAPIILGNSPDLTYATATLIKEEISRVAASFEDTDLMALASQQQMQKAKGQLLVRIDSMLQMGSSAAELQHAGQAGLLQLKSLQHSLASKTAGHKVAALGSAMLGIERNIQAAGFSLENFSYPIASNMLTAQAFKNMCQKPVALPEHRPGEKDVAKTAKRMLEQDPLWAYKKASVQQDMAVAELASMATAAVDRTLTFVGAAIALGAKDKLQVAGQVATWTGHAIANVASSACQLNATTQHACQSAVELGKQVKNAASQFVKDAAHSKPIADFRKRLAKPTLSLPNLLERRFLIPKEIGQAYTRNSLELALWTFPIGGAFKGSRAFFSAETKALISSFLKAELKGFCVLPKDSKKLIKELKKIGYAVVNGGKGSHAKLKKEGHPTLIVPKSSSLPSGLMHEYEKAYHKALPAPTKDSALVKNEAKEALSIPKDTFVYNHCGNKECAGKLIEDITNFSKIASLRTIDRVLEKDLMVVQYHGNGTVGIDRSLKWFMLPKHANQLTTLEEVMNNFGLLSVWGERTHVSIYRIPAGERLQGLVGKASAQIDKATGEMRPGGAIQLRLKNFNPEWIIETRALPK